MPNPRKLYTQVVSSYVLIILVFLIMLGIMGILAIPYYISPITYSNGGTPAGVGDLILSIMVVAIFLAGVFLLERRQLEFGSLLVVIGLIVITVLVWELYGFGEISNIYHGI
ncbi:MULTISPECIES: hypothetical protein [Acidianus]|uniref:Uncharacterized protein n=1 Tax=Candidatus Acidianus copahuensis TaxID=1160895 RepID=A0A031LJJ3_9CREN|nr:MULTISPECIES: hypothetical protein [Acidianus]EZQ02405.1 hypothetical protein CM19_10465 [Candidatus Acidianus copahuensis]NON63388.1 hypothetical protein [Acidianus sp. RZ1]